jgi:hypothetical protein
LKCGTDFDSKAILGLKILHSLPDPDYDVSDEEIAERVRQTKSGEVQTLSMNELRKAVFADRGRYPVTRQVLWKNSEQGRTRGSIWN